MIRRVIVTNMELIHLSFYLAWIKPSIESINRRCIYAYAHQNFHAAQMHLTDHQTPSQPSFLKYIMLRHRIRKPFRIAVPNRVGHGRDLPRRKPLLHIAFLQIRYPCRQIIGILHVRWRQRRHSGRKYRGWPDEKLTDHGDRCWGL